MRATVDGDSPSTLRPGNLSNMGLKSAADKPLRYPGDEVGQVGGQVPRKRRGREGQAALAALAVQDPRGPDGHRSEGEQDLPLRGRPVEHQLGPAVLLGLLVGLHEAPGLDRRGLLDDAGQHLADDLVKRPALVNQLDDLLSREHGGNLSP
jgi:hypothetical protein